MLFFRKVWCFHFFAVSLRNNNTIKEKMMELVKYNSREEMIAAYRKAKQRKKEWQEQCLQEYQKLKDSIEVMRS